MNLDAFAEMVSFSISPSYRENYPGVAFGLALISGCTNYPNPDGFDQYKRKLLRNMRKKENLAGITERIRLYDEFFHSFGFECPLPGHLNRTINSGFPRYNLMVDLHFMAEMCAGILVAVTDHDRFEGALSLDLAREGEICKGMGGQTFRTGEGEIVLRDQKEIVCVLCQGADEKTRVTEHTCNVLFYAYAVPGIEPETLEYGLDVAADAAAKFGNGRLSFNKIFTP